jgi:anti-anti-sigma regulatory factor
MKFFLIVAKGKRQGLPIPIHVDLFLIGSDPICQLRSMLPGIGEQHCALVNRDRKVFVRDLDSGLPTQVNDQDVPPGTEWALHAGDRLTVGPLEFVVQLREKPLNQRDLEEWALRCLDQDSGKVARGAHHKEDVFAEEGASDGAAGAAAAILNKLQMQRGVVQGQLRISSEAGVLVLRLQDQELVDPAELAALKRELHDQLNGKGLRVLIDFKNVQRMSAAGAEMIASLSGWLQQRNSRMAICRMPNDLQRLMRTLPHARNIQMFGEKPHALSAKW